MESPEKTNRTHLKVARAESRWSDEEMRQGQFENNLVGSAVGDPRDHCALHPPTGSSKTTRVKRMPF